MPAGLRGKTIDEVEVGSPLGRSWILLGRVLPVDYDDLCLAELEPGRRFLERSRTLAFAVWQHERVIEPGSEGACASPTASASSSSAASPGSPAPPGSQRPSSAPSFATVTGAWPATVVAPTVGAPASRIARPVALPTAVIFDNDGLLLDTESVWTRAEQELFARRGLEFTLAHKRELVGTSAQLSGVILARQLDEPGRAGELIAELDGLVFELLEGGVEPMPGALDLLADLGRSAVPTGLVSNSPGEFIARTLELVGLGDRFGVIVSGHDVAAPKPAPDAYLAACERLAVVPGADVIVLEDSPTGVAAARAAGLTVLGVPSLDGIELSEADRVYDSLAEPALRARLGLS